jgi:FAD:protein FMN transferase
MEMLSRLDRRSGDGPIVRSMPAFGTTATVAVTHQGALDHAAKLLAGEIAAMDVAASRFRPDSEVSRMREAGGEPVWVSPLMFEALLVALAVAEWTDGAVDPTVGGLLETLGYDRDFSQIATVKRVGPRPSTARSRCAAPGWRTVEMDHHERTVRVPRGTLIDLGATAKALSADRSAKQIASCTGSGTLVSIGGDIAVAGIPPPGGWAIGIAHISSAEPHELEQVVSVESGGLATSSTTFRAWERNEQMVHHIVDPTTGESARPCWSAVSVAASSCVEANAASTASVVWGSRAPELLALCGLPARLVSVTGEVSTVCGWPQEVSGPAAFAEVAS